jgi:hypothetical protein
MIFNSPRPLTAVLSFAGVLLTAWPQPADAQNPTPRTGSAAAAEPRDKEPAPKPNRPLSDDTAETLAAIRAMGPGVGGSADPQAQALLGQLAELMESQEDADSQAAAALLRERIGGAARPAPARTSGRTPK